MAHRPARSLTPVPSWALLLLVIGASAIAQAWGLWADLPYAPGVPAG